MSQSLLNQEKEKQKEDDEVMLLEKSGSESRNLAEPPEFNMDEDQAYDYFATMAGGLGRYQLILFFLSYFATCSTQYTIFNLSFFIKEPALLC